jgi:lipopolysaccharide cholinephosphotransferase
MKEISFEEAKQLELDILVDITNFCDSHGLRYCIAYGTLIGAIRHRGFIPWDDDIDINMPRKDYEEFLRTYNADGKKYRVIDPSSEMARHSFAKVIDTRTVKDEPMIAYEQPLGIDVDIFPLDGMPDNEQEFEEWYRELYKIYAKFTLKNLRAAYYPKLTTRLKLKAKQLFCPSRKKLLARAQALHEKYPYESSRFVGCVESQYNGKGNRTEKENFAETVNVEFEGLSFKAPIGYDQILRSLYGDYMQLPPEEKRMTHHTNKMYWRA